MLRSCKRPLQMNANGRRMQPNKGVLTCVKTSSESASEMHVGSH